MFPNYREMYHFITLTRDWQARSRSRWVQNYPNFTVDGDSNCKQFDDSDIGKVSSIIISIRNWTENCRLERFDNNRRNVLTGQLTLEGGRPGRTPAGEARHETPDWDLCY